MVRNINLTYLISISNEVVSVREGPVGAIETLLKVPTL